MVNPDRFYEDPEPADYEALADMTDTRVADDADATRKGEN